MNNNKKSQSGHIEMILSFVIFAGFVLAIFIFLNPISQEKVTYTALDDVQSRIFKNLSINYNSSSIILSSDVAGCFIVNNINNMDSRLIAIDSRGNVRPAKTDLLHVYVSSGSGRFYKLYSSNAFNVNDNVGTCNAFTGTYSFGVLSSDNSILYENLNNFNESYMNDYSELKSALGLKNDFVYIVYTTNKTILYQESISKIKIRSTNTISRDIPLRAITRNAQFVDLIFHLEVW